MTSKILPAINAFPNIRILVIGDLMLDHYIMGSTERTSPEAPVPVVLVANESFVAGGAANVTRNIVATGARVHCVGVAGDDPSGNQLFLALQEAGVDTSNIVVTPGHPTTTKTRIVSQGQQIVRLDREIPAVKSPAADQIRQRALGLIDSCDAVILSDYGKGTITPELVASVTQACKERNIPVFVDPKGRDYARYQGVYAITPNSREAHEATGLSTSSPHSLKAAATEISRMTNAKLVIITRGAEGLALLEESGELITIPTSAREVYDVTGAGDTFVAWLTLGVAAGLSHDDAARLANTAAGVAVGRVGPAVVSVVDIQQALASGRLGRKLVHINDLKTLGDQLRTAKKRIVLTNGCFDFLHAGHVAFLQQARALGDILILAMNTDESIRRIKEPPRPVISQMQRAELLASIDAVDYIALMDDDTPHEIIRLLQPDLLVKGSNYNLDEVEGAEIVYGYGGKVTTLPAVLDISTNRLVQGMQSPE